MMQHSFRAGQESDKLSTKWFTMIAKRKAPSVNAIVIHLRRFYLSNLSKEFSFEGYSSNQVKQILKYHGDAFIEMMNAAQIPDPHKPLSMIWFDKDLEKDTGCGWRVDPETNTVKFILFLLSIDPSFQYYFDNLDHKSNFEQLQLLGPLLWAISIIIRTCEKNRKDKLPTGSLEKNPQLHALGPLTGAFCLFKGTSMSVDMFNAFK